MNEDIRCDVTSLRNQAERLKVRLTTFAQFFAPLGLALAC